MVVKNNLFATAKTIVEAPKPLKKGEKEEVFIKDLDGYAALDALQKTLEGAKDMVRGPVVVAMIKKFVDSTILTKDRPENFKGIGLKSEASCELRKRSSASILKESEVALLKQYGIQTENKEISPATEEEFLINPAIVANAKMANEVSTALSKLPSLKGMDIILRKAPKDAEIVQIVSDKSFEDAAKITDRDALEQIYQIIGTPSIKPKMTSDDLKTVLDIIASIGIKLSTDDKKKSSK